MVKDSIRTKCPSCGWKSLFIGKGGYITCGNLDCKEPNFDAALATYVAEQERLARRYELENVAKLNGAALEPNPRIAEHLSISLARLEKPL